mgnify:CR=1 FL=1
MVTKGRDISPLIGESFGRMGTGPYKKNLVIPKALAAILITNVITGRAWLKSLNEVIVCPAEFFG